MPEQSRRFVVTGAAGGIGMAVAAAALREGNRVALLDRQLVAEVGDTDSLGASVEHRLDLGTDVSDAVEVETAFAAVSAEWGGIDVLVNCAGIAEPTPVINADIDAWDRIIATNLLKRDFALSAVLPLVDPESNVSCSRVRCRSGSPEARRKVILLILNTPRRTLVVEH